MSDAIDAALETYRTVTVPDPRTTVSDLDVQGTNAETLRLVGTVATMEQLVRAKKMVEAVTNRSPDVNDVSVLERAATTQTVQEKSVAVRSSPSTDAEQVTEARYGGKIRVYDQQGDWKRVRVCDGYVGWVQTDSLVELQSIDATAILTDRIVGHTRPGMLPPGTDCEITSRHGDATVIKFRTGSRVKVPSASIFQKGRRLEPRTAVKVARSFLGTTYEWGGKTIDGIDCSGLVWVAYQSINVPLPRDADQQQRIGRSIDRNDLCEGDLLFFPGHVAMSLGGDEFIHAYGDTGDVRINSLDSDDDRYLAALDDDFKKAQRVIDQ